MIRTQMVPDLVTLVDRDDNVIGAEEKIRAHREGKLHRAFSVFVFDNQRNLLMQRPRRGQVPLGGLWSNTCCGHPRPGESPRGAASRRLVEEMGFSCDLEDAFHVVYRAELDNSLVEHELDRVFVGRYDGMPQPDPSEVEETRWIALEDLRRRLTAEPHVFTRWLQLLVEDKQWVAVERLLAAPAR
jgi:isopentenyl-diphosphate delta-isomerase